MRLPKLPFKVFSLIVVNAGIYASSALYYCFIQIYLSTSHDAVTVGSLLSIGQAVSVFAPIIWGVWADKARYKNNVLLVAVLASGLCYLAVMLSNDYLWLAAVLAATMFSLSAFGGLVDTITIEYASTSGYRYGTIRVMGTLAYGLVACGLSLVIDKNINLIFIIYAAICAITCFFLLFSPKVEGHAHRTETKRPKMDFRAIFSDKRLMWMMVFMAAAQLAWAYYLNFYPSYIKNVLQMPDWVWGVNILITVLGEIPFFLCFNKLFNKLGIKKVMFAALILTIVRCSLLALVAKAVWMLVVGGLTGISITLFTYCCAIYISENIAPEIQATAQTVMYSLAMGVPKILAGIGGGLMTTAFGTKSCLLFCAGLAALCLALFPIAMRKREMRRSD